MTLIFAHRGFSENYPENTMIAFEMADKHCADGIEFDVHLSKDGEVVVIHDETVTRTTNGSGFVKDLPFSTLKSFSIKEDLTQTIPSLDEVLQWIVTTNLIINIELKTDIIKYEKIEEKVINLVKKYNLLDRVIISSFNNESLLKTREICPEIETALLYSFCDENPMQLAKTSQTDSLHPKNIAITDEMVVNCQKSGIPVRPFAVDGVEELSRFFKINTTAVITDDPTVARKVRSEIQRELQTV